MTNQHDEAIKKLDEFTLRLLEKGDTIPLLPAFTILTEAESFPFVKEIPLNAVHWLVKGLIQHVQDNFQQAVTAFTKAIPTDPDYATAFYRRGATSKNREMGGSAGRLHRGHSAQSRRRHSFLSPGLHLHQNREMGGGAGRLNRGYTARSRRRHSFLSPEPGLRQNGGRAGEALADITKGLRINPKFPLRFKNFFLIYIKIEKWGKALADYMKALKDTLRNHFNRIIKRK